jgi:hypothetical protein
MDTSIEQYGAGAGLVFGAGVGGTVGTLLALETSLALVAGFGASGGLVVGAIVGRIAAGMEGQTNWVWRATGFTLGLGLLAGALIGATVAWTVDGALLDGVLVGAASGLGYGTLLTATLLHAGRGELSADKLGLGR